MNNYMKLTFTMLLLTCIVYSATAVEGGSHDSALSEQLSELKERVHRLETAIKGTSSDNGSMKGMDMGSAAPNDGMQGMGGMDKKKKMGGMQNDTMQQQGTSDQGMGMGKMDMGMMGKGMGMMGMMGMMKKDMGMQNMMMMGMAGADQQMTMTSALPGFPGSSHIYHIGSTGFFTNHAEHIELTAEQLEKLNALKEKSSLNQATHDRALAAAEQELWELTAVDEPDAQKINDKLKEIAGHFTDKRMDFIRSVGAAAETLTVHQRHVLLGKAKSDGTDHSKH